ncbi:MAG: VPLPA-CTERM-specific exosortase XrtD [Desulfovibrio sp.]
MESSRNYRPLLLALLFWLACAAVLFGPHFPGLFSRWGGEDNSYCYLVPPIVAYMLYLGRDRYFPLCPAGGAKTALAVHLFLAFSFLAGLLGSLETLVYGAMWLGVAALAATLGGAAALRRVWFPLLVLLFAVPLPVFINRLLTFRLRLLSTELSVRFLELLRIPAYADGNIIDMGVTKLQVVDACSGLRYLMPALLMGLLLGWFFHSRVWKRLLLTLLAIPVTILANALRIAMTGVLVAYVSPEFGQGFLHDFSGWLVYMVSIGLLGAASVLLRPDSRDGRPRTAEAAAPRSCHVPASIWPRLMVGGVVLLLTWTAGHLLLHRQSAPPRETFASFPLRIGDWEGKRFYLEQKILDQLWADDYVTGNYRNTHTGNSLHLMVSYYGHQTTEHTAHAPTSCLLGGGWDLTSRRTLAPAPKAGRSFPVVQLLLQKPGATVISNFWFQQRGRIITSEWLNKLWLVADSLSMGRSDGALVRVELYLNPDQTPEQGQELLDRFNADLFRELAPHVPGR